MSSDKFRRTISSVYDAALVPDLWPAALQSVMDEVGAVGAHYSRLAVALLAGKRLGEVSRDFGVQITTLRTQLSSILRKTGVTRQVDLIRLLSNVPVIPEGAPEIKYGR